MSARTFFVLIGRDIYRARGSFLFGLMAAVIVCFLLMLPQFIKEKKLWLDGKCMRNAKIGRKFLLAYYIAFIVSLTCLSRKAGSRGGMNLDLFSTWTGDMRAHTFFIENILIFVPAGILLAMNFFMFQKALVCIIAGFLISFAMECVQLFTGRGFFQIDDILTNGIGCAVGWALENAAEKWRKRKYGD